MALKFLNKKGWHTGSIRNIENVWKAEQKHEAEQRKLEELKKQIQDEREKSEFRLLQEQAGLVPRQERLEFLYESGLAVGKSMDGASSSGGSGVPFKALGEAAPGVVQADGSSSAGKVAETSKDSSLALGALFEDKPLSANDAWRKLHSDPLLLIRQREQDTLARIKNNPVQMALIRKSVEVKKEKGKSRDEKGHRKKHKKHSTIEEEFDSEDSGAIGEKKRHTDDRKRSKYNDSRDEKGHRKKHKKHSTIEEEFDSEDSDAVGEKKRNTDDRKRSKYNEVRQRGRVYSDDESKKDSQRRNANRRDVDQPRNRKRSPNDRKDSEVVRDEKEPRKYRGRSPDWISESRAAKGDDKNARHLSTDRKDPEAWKDEREPGKFREGPYKSSTTEVHADSRYKRRSCAPKLSEEERAAKLREMQMDAELHEEQRWTRLKKADEDDAKEAAHPSKLGGKNFLHAAHKSVYGAEKGGSSTIEESVRRRTHYSQRGSGDGNSNAFLR